MTVAKLLSTSYNNLGRKGTRQDNEMTAITGLILTTPDFTDTVANLALKATWVAGIKAGTVFPLNGLDSYEVQNSEDKIYEAPSGNRKLLRRGKSRYMFNLDIPLDVHQALQSFNNGDLTLWIVRDGKICFYDEGGLGAAGKGFTTNMINAGRMGEVPADGATPAYSPLYIDLANYREWDVYGAFLEPDGWEPTDLEGIIDVVPVQYVGTKTTTIVQFKVYANDGYTGTGAVKEVLIKGLLAADILFTKASDGTAQATWTLSEAAGTGIYTITASVAASLVAGKLTIKSPTSVTDGLIIKHNAAAIDIAVT